MDGMTINHIVSIDHGSCGEEPKDSRWVQRFLHSRQWRFCRMVRVTIERGERSERRSRKGGSLAIPSGELT